MPGTRKRSTRSARGSRNAVAPRSGEDMRAIARKAAFAAIARLSELSNSEDERVALAATQELLNRAFGKIGAAASDDQGAAAQQLVIKIVRFAAENVEAQGDKAGDRP
jgi:hypothetical protein